MEKIIRLNLVIMHFCCWTILSVLTAPLTVKALKLIHYPTDDMHINIYKIPVAPYLLFFIEAILILGIIMNDKASRKLQQPSTKQSLKSNSMNSESAKLIEK